LPESVGLAFKAYEIEEIADVYFFRPSGMIFARAARALHLTPTAVTIAGSLVGLVGGAMLYSESLGLIAFAVIIFHSVLDSSDGQLARMTGQVTELGRVLDGVGGYVTHAAIFLAIGASMFERGWGGSAVVLMLGAGASTIVHAQMYDYHRTSYARTALKGIAAPPAALSRRGVLRIYERMQRALSGLHPRVEREIAARSPHGTVRDDDRARYRSCFYWPVRGWNALGDNTRFYAVGVLAWMHRLDLFFTFVLVPMNAVFAALWLWELRADRRFLAGL
jgi:phosphatidylglycerophosphate synthase